ncbi:hypothetical protein [Amycolatopsis cihanbeyliensis]|uniref:Uncharacterized protein n=1 Tax=Amycolatopsis cihanbeyliensis TaxID=1128664 RepID=A0A542DG36_AMYCI|nr:hypothetical protein FB471_1718 [Amycolatopsis cihanbeyliensis]
MPVTRHGRLGAMVGAIAVGVSTMVFTPAATAAVPRAEALCTVRDERLAELSGLAADEDHWYAVNDGGTRIEVFVLGHDCRVERVLTDPTDPFDVEDMARAADGTLWLSDTGDNDKRRETIALHAVSPEGGATLYRLTYPDGQHDAEALLLDRAGTPHVITKHVLGKAEVYRPSGKLDSPGPTKLEHVGSLRIDATDTPGGPVGTVGSMLVTGAAASVDGTVFALRTYTDAYLYPAPEGDVLAALQREPLRIPLPEERQGEAIAFDPEGTLLSASEGVGQPVRAVRDASALATARGAEPGAAGTAGTAAASPAAGAEAAEQDPEAEEGLPTLPAVAVALGVALALVFGIDKLRRR